MPRTPKIEIFPGVDGWRIRVRAANGEILMTSEAFASNGNARRAAKRLVRVVLVAAVVEVDA